MEAGLLTAAENKTKQDTAKIFKIKETVKHQTKTWMIKESFM